MAFDFLGTFTKKMWTSFDKFASSVIYGNLLSTSSTSLEYDSKKHQFKQTHLPRVRDHQLAESQRINIYRNKLQTVLRKKFVNYDNKSSLVMYNPFPGPAYPKKDQKDQTSWILEGYYPVNTNDDYNTADMLMYIKSKISKFIKSRFEREEYRVKKCVDFVDTTLDEHDSLDILIFGNSAFLNYSSIKQQIYSSFTNKNNAALLQSQISVDPDNLDGESTSSTDKAVANNSGGGYIIPGDPQKVIYRGLLHQKLETLGSPAETEAFKKLRIIQNPLSPE